MRHTSPRASAMEISGWSCPLTVNAHVPPWKSGPDPGQPPLPIGGESAGPGFPQKVQSSCNLRRPPGMICVSFRTRCRIRGEPARPAQPGEPHR
jgi:hypothetical protein